MTRSDKLTLLSLSIAGVAFFSLIRLHKPLDGEDRYHAMVQKIRKAQERENSMVQQ